MVKFFAKIIGFSVVVRGIKNDLKERYKEARDEAEVKLKANLEK
jgi:hypothetical protein